MKKFLITICATLITVQAFAGDLVIVTNKKNPIAKISKKDLRAMYLFKKTTWSDGTKVELCMPGSKTDAFAEFTKAFLGKSAKQAHAYYLNRSLKGKGVPPREFKTDKELLEFVKDHAGAIGIASKESNLENVSVVAIEEE